MTLSGLQVRNMGVPKGELIQQNEQVNGTAQTGLQRRVRCPYRQVSEAMPVVRAIPAHIEEIPSLPRQLAVQIRQQLGRRITDRLPLLHVP
jgi:hypothetical protein